MHLADLQRLAARRALLLSLHAGQQAGVAVDVAAWAAGHRAVVAAAHGLHEGAGVQGGSEGT